MARLARRHPEAVRELEALQQADRAGAGEPALTAEAFADQLRESVRRWIVAGQLDAGGLDAVIEGAEELEARAEAAHAQLAEAFRIDEPDQWSRFEMAPTLCEIAAASARVEAAFAGRGWPLPEAPVVGTLTTGQVAAVTQVAACGAPLVLIDNGFFRFGGTLSQAAVFADHDLLFRGGFSGPALQLMSDLVATQAVQGSCLHLYQRPTPAQVLPAVEGLRAAITHFVLGHEFGHVSVGDLDAHPRRGPTAGISLRSREFVADRYGAIAALDATTPRGVGVYGPLLYLAGLDVAGRAAAAYRGTVPATHSASPEDYPTPYERVVELLAWLRSEPALAPLGPVVQRASTLFHTILFLWDRIHPAFAASREALAQFDPARYGNAPVLPEAVTFGLVQTLWRAVLAAEAASAGQRHHGDEEGRDDEHGEARDVQPEAPPGGPG